MHHQRAGASGDRRRDRRVLSWTFAFSTAAWSASTVALSAVDRRSATCRPARACAMPRSRQILESAWPAARRSPPARRSRSRLACACCSAASSGRRSSAKSTCPCGDVVAFREVDARSADRWSGRGWRRVENGSAAPMTRDLDRHRLSAPPIRPRRARPQAPPPRPPRPLPGARRRSGALFAGTTGNDNNFD